MHHPKKRTHPLVESQRKRQTTANSVVAVVKAVRDDIVTTHPAARHHTTNCALSRDINAARQLLDEAEKALAPGLAAAPFNADTLADDVWRSIRRWLPIADKRNLAAVCRRFARHAYSSWTEFVMPTPVEWTDTRKKQKKHETTLAWLTTLNGASFARFERVQFVRVALPPDIYGEWPCVVSFWQSRVVCADAVLSIHIPRDTVKERSAKSLPPVQPLRVSGGLIMESSSFDTNSAKVARFLALFDATTVKRLAVPSIECTQTLRRFKSLVALVYVNPWIHPTGFGEEDIGEHRHFDDYALVARATGRYPLTLARLHMQPHYDEEERWRSVSDRPDERAGDLAKFSARILYRLLHSGSIFVSCPLSGP
jgi:hypothetical protein